MNPIIKTLYNLQEAQEWFFNNITKNKEVRLLKQIGKTIIYFLMHIMMKVFLKY